MRMIAPIRIVAALGLVLAACACDKASELSFGGTPDSMTSIADLKRLCREDTYRITHDITIQGLVTANDRFREFSKMIVIEDASGGIPVLIDHTATGQLYPFRTSVTIHCNGLALGRNGDKIQLGAIPTGEYSVDRIPRAEADRYIRVTGKGAEAQPISLRFDEVSAQYVDRLVRFDNVRFTTDGPWCDPEPETLRPETCEREIADADSGTFIVRIPGACIYATEPAPSGTGSICGIIDYFNGKYSLSITNRMFDFRVSATHPTAYLSAGGYSCPSPTR